MSDACPRGPGPLRRLGDRAASLLARLDASLGLAPGTHEHGGATVEFVLLVPAFLMVFISSFEASILLTRQVMLERSVDLAVREIRLDTSNTVSRGSLRSQICEHARILPDCQMNLVVELTLVDTDTWDVPDADAPCVNRLTSIVPPAEFARNRTGKLVLLRACYSVVPALPLSTLPMEAMFGTRTLGSYLLHDEDGTIRIVTANAFVVEAN